MRRDASRCNGGLARASGAGSTTTGCDRGTTIEAAGDAGDDADGVAVFGRRRFLREVADVFVVDVDVDEAAQFTVFGEEVLLQITELGGEIGESFADGFRGDFGGV